MACSIQVLRLPDFMEWFHCLDPKGRAQVDARILRIQEESYFGDAKYLNDGLIELRWKSGRRVYFARFHNKDRELIVLIIGGNKNGQKKDIAKARVLLQRYAEAIT